MTDVTRWSAFTDDSSPLDTDYLVSSDPGVRVHDAGTSYRFGMDGSSAQEQTSVNLYTPHNSSSIVASARTAWGTPVDAYSLKDDDLVDVGGGMQTSVAVARTMRLIAAGRDGRFEDVAQASQPNAPQEAPAQQYETFANKHDEAALNRWVNTTSPGEQVRALYEVFEKGEVSKDTLNMLASQAGVEPHQMEARVNKVFAAYERQADAVVSKAGVPNDAFWSWAEGQREGELRHAMAELTMQRSSKTLAKLAGEFVDYIPVDMVLGADFGPGIKAQKMGDQAVLFIEGAGSMTLGAAIKAGLVTLSRGR